MQEIADFFAAQLDDDQASTAGLAPRYNIAPTNTVAGIVATDTRHVEGFYWGLVPSWAKDKRVGSRMINARAETLLEKPVFRGLLSRRRCIIPVDGFYEWIAEGKTRQPMHIEIEGRPIFGLAGLWDRWRIPDGDTLQSMTIITVPANAMMSPIHDRMPAILGRDDEASWLDSRFKDPQELSAMLRPYPQTNLRAYRVSSKVNKPGIEDPTCIAPLTQESAPEPGQMGMML